MVSIETVLCDEIDLAVCRTHQPLLDLESREAFDYVMAALSPEERRIASLVAEHGIRPAARELGVSWRQVYNALERMREVFEKAGFGPDRAPRRARGQLARRP